MLLCCVHKIQFFIVAFFPVMTCSHFVSFYCFLWKFMFTFAGINEAGGGLPTTDAPVFVCVSFETGCAVWRCFRAFTNSASTSSSALSQSLSAFFTAQPFANQKRCARSSISRCTRRCSSKLNSFCDRPAGFGRPESGGGCWRLAAA